MPKLNEQDFVLEFEEYALAPQLAEEERKLLEDAKRVILRLIHQQSNFPVASVVKVIKMQPEDLKSEIEAKYIPVEEVAELFGISQQGVYKWINKGKVDFEEVHTPGGSKKLILRAQFNDPKYHKQIESVRRTREALAKVKPPEKEEDLYPISNNQSQMEELDVK
ncbi:helix-turn-helix domain-containing protein [Paenibacillus alkaliterrae]|uniref:helix-turn-helix domain-containing protein n=1 Tax=Paenibacillus alkaliterrae TaxID=320909 RepID=UPI001F209957|nr:helix-turn-helix domain-containing protein [Paenibacillus alkaliterrae]MCF2939771.1 helix-turn-helix domain-containing protein [Paenibacillus alkaliterrae]